MPKLTMKTLLITAAIGAVSTPSMAQITKVTEPVNVPTRVIDADFVIADINEDGSLDRDEFVSFAVIKSDAGHDKYRAIVASGQFDKTFAVHDHNADGKITANEMGHGKRNSAVNQGLDVDVIAPELKSKPAEEPDYGSGTKSGDK